MTVEETPDEPAYGPEDLTRIAKIVGLSELPEDAIKKFKITALLYQISAGLDVAHGGRAVQRKLLQCIAADAKKLKAEIEALNSRFVGEELDLPIGITTRLDELVVFAETTAKAIPKTGALPSYARHEFVRDIAPIYFSLTGKAPSRRTSTDGRPEGPFHEFVDATLRPLDPHRCSGIDKVIRDVLADMETFDG